MRVLLDTCVLSELRRPNIQPNVFCTIQNLENKNMYVSVLSIGELLKGITMLAESKKKRDLHHWVITLEQEYQDRILPIDIETCRIWGEITAAAQKKGKIVPMGDGLIASSAIRHGLHVMTRNVHDFEATGAMLINPWG